MRPRSGFFSSSRGFSLVSTLVAVAIGGIVASLVATVISEAVKSQRSIVDRDEMSEFSLFLKDQLMTDKTCEVWLAGRPYIPNPTMNKSILPQEFSVALAGGFGDNQTDPIGRGFAFSAKKIIVKSLTLEDKGLKGTPAKIDGKNTQRFVVRVTLNLTNVDGQGFRSRYFEIPVLVDMDTKTIYKCNAELNVADACEALGFSYDPVAGACTASTDACLNGGIYVDGSGGSGRSVVNPATGGLSCPAGFTAAESGSINITSSKKSGLDYDKVYQCLKCK